MTFLTPAVGESTGGGSQTTLVAQLEKLGCRPGAARLERGAPLLLRGEALDEVLIIPAGTVQVFRAGLEPLALTGPLVLDRWMANSLGVCCCDVMARSEVDMFRLAHNERAKVFGLIPELRELSAEHREAIFGKRTLLPRRRD